MFVALRGSTSQIFAEKFFPKAKLVLTDDYDQAVAMVRQNKAHAMVADFPLFINWLQNSLNTLERSGEMQALVEKWFEDNSWVKYLR